MKSSILVVSLFFFMSISECYAAPAGPSPKELLDLKVGYVSGESLVVPSDERGIELPLKKFIKSVMKWYEEKGMHKQGKWKKIDNKKWIYNMKSADNNIVSLLFVRHTERQDVVILTEILVNGDTQPFISPNMLVDLMVTRSEQELKKEAVQ